MLYSASKIKFSFFKRFTGIVHPNQFNFLNILGDDLFIVAYRFNPDKLILTGEPIFYFSSDQLSSFFCGISPIENGDFVFFSIQVIYQVIKT